MARVFRKREKAPPGSFLFDDAHYRDIKRRNIARLFLTYMAPLILLTVFFVIQHSAMMAESRRFHLRAIAENQANTLDLFLSERLVNLSNLIDDPQFHLNPPSTTLQEYLSVLQKNSETFVDIGYFDSAGVQASYAGPYPSLEKRNYSMEPWYTTLRDQKTRFVITDIYLGFRQMPHFTIAVSRIIDNRLVVLRATLSPEKMYDYISSLEGSGEVFTSIVNTGGYYQVVTPHIGTPLETSSIVPPAEPRLGVEEVEIEGADFTYAYSWLRMADWALTVQWTQESGTSLFSGLRLRILLIAAAIIILTFLIILNRSRKLAELQRESDRTRAELEHAAKLASVGELAAGIAHEINNPLAIISEEAGLVKDLMNPEFGQDVPREQLLPHLDNISESVFRCRDITRKLLGFVRKTEVDLKPCDVRQLIDTIVDGFIGPELTVANIEIVRQYDPDVPSIVTDGNQLQQVLLNIFNNAADAIGDRPGTITISLDRDDDRLRLAVTDTGRGMSPDQMDKIFLPFYTTKEVGKGTGLGLSVSYGIIKSLGGDIEATSAVGEGTTFTISLPLT